MRRTTPPLHVGQVGVSVADQLLRRGQMPPTVQIVHPTDDKIVLCRRIWRRDSFQPRRDFAGQLIGTAPRIRVLQRRKHPLDR